jgi:hypothetical protein
MALQWGKNKCPFVWVEYKASLGKKWENGKLKWRNSVYFFFWSYLLFCKKESGSSISMISTIAFDLSLA